MIFKRTIVFAVLFSTAYAKKTLRGLQVQTLAWGGDEDTKGGLVGGENRPCGQLVGCYLWDKTAQEELELTGNDKYCPSASCGGWSVRCDTAYSVEDSHGNMVTAVIDEIKFFYIVHDGEPRRMIHFAEPSEPGATARWINSVEYLAQSGDKQFTIEGRQRAKNCFKQSYTLIDNCVDNKVRTTDAVPADDAPTLGPKLAPSASPTDDAPTIGPAVAPHEASKRIPKVLPLMNVTGGLVVFLHVAKTGGTTIRDAIRDDSEFDNVEVLRVFNEERLNAPENTQKIDWYLSSNNNRGKNGNGETLLLEIHGGKGQPMTVFQIHTYLQGWRSKAAATNKKIFVFTILREPVSFYVSYFNFFKHPECTWVWCDPPLFELTEDNLLATIVPNHQCQYLARKVNKEENAAVPVSKSECDAVYELMKADADWIGATETMQDTTLPLLSYLLTGNAETGRGLVVKNKQPASGSKLSLKSLSKPARQIIRDVSTLDQDLYARAARDFTIDMWDNYNKESWLLTTSAS